jgi:cell division protease FtsH
MRTLRLVSSKLPHSGGRVRVRAFPDLGQLGLSQAPPLRISYSDFLNQTNAEQVEEAKFHQHDSDVDLVKSDGTSEVVTVPNKTHAMDLLVEHGANVYLNRELNANDFSTAIIWLIQLGVVIALFRMFSGGMGTQGALSKLTKVNDEGEIKNTGVTFDEVAGAESAKQDLKEIVDFLKNPEMYSRVGAKVPKGVLLHGSPGTGKTLLARAVAGEAGVPFFSCSGSEFIQMFVGVGASRLRDVFAKAKKAAPAIIFIDEIDAIGRKRSADGGQGGGNAEHDQTINQLLTAMDGFEKNTGVIVIGATNRMDVLDEALLRPGRFDRRVFVELPDANGRLEILKIHTRGKPMDVSVSLESLSRRTVGFSGADLESLCNEAAIYAARAKRNVIVSQDFDDSFEKLTMGEARRTTFVSTEKKWILSVHEAGHAITGMLINFADPVHKVTIVPRGNAGGVTYFEPSPDKDLHLETRHALEQRMKVAFGGRAAEEVVFGPNFITTGASGDLQNVYSIAYDMIVHYGFSRDLGPVSWQETSGLASDIDLEIKELSERLYTDTKDLLIQHRSLLEELAQYLFERETLDRAFLEDFAKKIRTDLISHDEE